MPLRASDIAIINKYTRAELIDTIFVGNFFLLKGLITARRRSLSLEATGVSTGYETISVETFVYSSGEWQTSIDARVDYQGTGLKRVGDLDVYVSSYTFYINSETSADISVPNETYGKSAVPYFEVIDWFQLASGSDGLQRNDKGEYGTWIYYNGNIFRLTGISLSTTYPHLLKIQAELDYFELFDTQLTNPDSADWIGPENLEYILAGNAIRQNVGVPYASQFLTTQNSIQIVSQTGANIKTQGV